MTEKKVILFDGECKLCNGFVNFVVPRDPKRRFQFAYLQSPAGERLSQKFGIQASDLKTIILIERDERAYTKSTAVLRIVKYLWRLWPLLYVFIIVPRCIRNWVYDWIARNRYQWFGKFDQCQVPTPDVEDRFLD